MPLFSFYMAKVVEKEDKAVQLKMFGEPGDVSPSDRLYFRPKSIIIGRKEKTMDERCKG